jgi:hypothetical protein
MGIYGFVSIGIGAVRSSVAALVARATAPSDPACIALGTSRPICWWLSDGTDAWLLRTFSDAFAGGAPADLHRVSWQPHHLSTFSAETTALLLRHEYGWASLIIGSHVLGLLLMTILASARLRW